MSGFKEHCPAILLLVVVVPIAIYVFTGSFLDELLYRHYGPERVSGISDVRCDRLDGSIEGRVHLTAREVAIIDIGLYTELEGVWARVDDTEVEFEISTVDIERPDGGIKRFIFKTDEAEFELHSPVTDKVRDYEIWAEGSNTKRVVARSEGERGAPLLLTKFTC